MCSAVFFSLLPFRLQLNLYAPYCPLFWLNLVVYLVCTKILSELLSIWFLHLSDNTTTSAKMVCLHTPHATTHSSYISLPSTRASVATAIADVFRNNGISMGRNLAKILKIFEEIDEAKSRGVI
jgi:hypothetical protein